MAYRRRQSTRAPVWFGDWTRPALPILVGSEAQRRLEDALLRYCRGEVSGRTFLIAGHRGAGKTSLVRNTVEEATREVLRRLGEEAEAGMVPERSLLAVPQRPLLVRINGAGLLIDELPGPGAGETSPAVRQAARAAATGGAVTDDDPPTRPDETQSILLQLTSGLYRALAAEISLCFSQASAVEGGGTDAAEISAQLELALDDGADPALLRYYWESIGTLDRGVVWPRLIGSAIADGALSGQGVREVVATATAGRIFQICIGKVSATKKQTDKNTATRNAGDSSASSDGSVSTALRPAAGGLIGALLGGVAGYALSGNTISVVAAAAAGALGLGWTAGLNLQRTDELHYDITLDRSAASLERDLPLALGRIREAGLAPVFVIDELDKLENAGWDTMHRMILRLKQLMTDYGFFCFLTDRAYYDRLQKEIENHAYPVEYSFFSERLYVLPEPKDLEAYLLDAIEAPAPEPGDVPFLEAAATFIYAKNIAHRSKLNMIDAVRMLDSPCAEKPEAMRIEPRFRLRAAVQVAIESVMARPDFTERARQDGSFRQLLVDALYVISRAWEGDEDLIALDEDGIALRILQRLHPDAVRAGAKASLEAESGKRDVALIIEAVRDLATLLADFSLLAGRPAAQDAVADTLAIISETRPALLATLTDPQTGQTAQDSYRFLFDPFGRALDLPEREAADLPTALFAAGQMAETARQLRQMLETCLPGWPPVSLNTLVEMRLLPHAYEDAAIREACFRLAAAADSHSAYRGFFNDLRLIEDFVDVFAARRSGLIALFLAAIAVARHARAGPEACLRRVCAALLGRRPFGLSRQIDEWLTHDRCWAALNASPFAVESVIAGMPELELAPPELAAGLADAGPVNVAQIGAVLKGYTRQVFELEREPTDWAAFWARKRDILAGKLPGPDDPMRPVHLDDLSVAVSGPMPLRDLPASDRDPARPSTAGWSFLALEALGGDPERGGAAADGPSGAIPPPGWVAVPALYALGFSHSVLAGVLAVQPADAAGASLASLVEAAAERETAGYLLVAAGDAARSEVPYTRADDVPILIVESDRVGQYAAALKLLRDLGAFQGTIDERPSR